MDCTKCGKQSRYVCAKCNSQYYCSRKCQKSHWKKHSLVCNKKQVDVKPYWSNAKKTDISKFRWRWRMYVENVGFKIYGSQFSIYNVDLNRKIFTSGLKDSNRINQILVLDNMYVVVFYSTRQISDEVIVIKHIDYLKMRNGFFKLTNYIDHKKIIVEELNGDPKEIKMTGGVIKKLHIFNSLLYMFDSKGLIIIFNYKTNSFNAIDLKIDLDLDFVNSLTAGNFMFLIFKASYNNKISSHCFNFKTGEVAQIIEFDVALSEIYNFDNYYYFITGSKYEGDHNVYKYYFREEKIFELIKHVRFNAREEGKIFLVKNPDAIVDGNHFFMFLLDGGNLIRRLTDGTLETKKTGLDHEYVSLIENRFYQSGIQIEVFDGDNRENRTPITYHLKIQFDFKEKYTSRLNEIAKVYLSTETPSIGKFDTFDSEGYEIETIFYPKYLLPNFHSKVILIDGFKLTTRKLLGVLFGLESIKNKDLPGFYHLFKSNVSLKHLILSIINKVGGYEFIKDPIKVVSFKTKIIERLNIITTIEGEKDYIKSVIKKPHVKYKDFNDRYNDILLNKNLDVYNNLTITMKDNEEIKSIAEILCFEHAYFFEGLLGKLKKRGESYDKFKIEFLNNIQVFEAFRQILFSNQLDKKIMEDYDLIKELSELNKMYFENDKTIEQFFIYFNSIKKSIIDKLDKDMKFYKETVIGIKKIFLEDIFEQTAFGKTVE